MFHSGDDYLYPTKGTLHDHPKLASPKSRFLSVGLFFSRVLHQALYVLVTLHLQSSIKSSCCAKLSFISPSTFFFVTLLFILELHFAHIQDLPHEPKMYKHSTTPTEVQTASDQVLSINWQMNTMLLTQVLTGF